MTFSDFAKVLFTYCNEGEKQGDFVVHITNKIMGGRPGREHGDGSYQNPLGGKDNDILLHYLNGNRSIPQCDASIILRRIDKYKFEEYLRSRCSEDAQKLLRKDLAAIEEIPDGDIVEICADLFEQILHDLAEKKNK